MKTSYDLVNRLKEILTEGKWLIGTNIKEQIIDLNWKQATQKVADLNSIADLTFHLSYYIAGLVKVLEGGPLDIRDKYSFDYPVVSSKEEWRGLINKFCEDSESFIRLVGLISEDKLKDVFVDERYGNYQRNINGIIEHCYYHAGQIVLLKKLIRQNE